MVQSQFPVSKKRLIEFSNLSKSDKALLDVGRIQSSSLQSLLRRGLSFQFVSRYLQSLENQISGNRFGCLSTWTDSIRLSDQEEQDS